MTGPDGPVPLRAGALRALLRQPDLPPDLIAKISARADHLTRAEQRGAGARGWHVPWSRLPIIVAILMTFVVAAGIAFSLLPMPPEAGFISPSMTEDAPSPPAALAPDVPAPMEVTPPAVHIGAKPVAGAVNATPVTDIGKEEARPSASAARSPSASGHAKASTAAAVARPANTGGPSKEVGAPERQSGGKTGAPRLTVAPGSSATPLAGAPSVGDIAPAGIAREVVAPVTIDVPVAVPVIDPTAQP